MISLTDYQVNCALLRDWYN